MEGVERAPVDVERLVSEGADWEARYDELLAGALGQREAEGRRIQPAGEAGEAGA